MNATPLMLSKDTTPFTWSYLYNQERYTIVVPKSPLLEQMVYALTTIRDTHNLHETPITVVSPQLIRQVFYDLVLAFPNMSFVPLNDVGVSRVFRKVMYREQLPTLTKTRNGRGTLFICSDASRADSNNQAGWAWFSTVAGPGGYGFGVSTHHSIVHAELEGILRAVLDNANTTYSTLHVYCDSRQSVQWADDLIHSRNLTSRKLNPFNEQMVSLIHQVREIRENKNLRFQWVKGHASHRLNTAADYLSREARVAATRREKLTKTTPKIAGVMAFMG